MDKQFSLNEILVEAWALAKKNIWITMGFTAIQFAVILISLLLSGLTNPSAGLGLLQNIIIGLVDAFFTVSIYRVFFKLIDEEGEPEFPDFMPSLVKALNFILVKILVGLLIVFIIASVAAIYYFNSPQIDPTKPLS